MKTATKKIDMNLRDEWLQSVASLAARVQVWVSQESDWHYEDKETQQREEAGIGQYSVTIWSVLTPQGEVRFEPMPADFLGRRFVEVYAWPTLRRVHLLPAADGPEWKILTDSGIFLRQEWNRENCLTLIRDLIAAE